MTEKFTNI